jgi:hypothetical protein
MLNTAVLLAPTPPDGMSLALYDAMCRAIDAAYEVDEVKDIRDKARAFEVYARMAQNVEAERRACEIRLRSERKAGALLKQIDRAKAEYGRPLKASTRPRLSDFGISYDQSSDWRRLADIPEDQFEAALADPARMPTTAGIIAAGTAPQPEVVPVSPHALWLWGRLFDFERDGMLKRDQREVLLTLTPRMQDDVHRLAPQVANWLSRIGKDTA